MSEPWLIERSTSDIGRKAHALGSHGWLLLEVVAELPDGSTRRTSRVYETEEDALVPEVPANELLVARPGRTKLTLEASDGSPIRVLVDLVAPLDRGDTEGFDPLADFDLGRAVIPPRQGVKRR